MREELTSLSRFAPLETPSIADVDKLVLPALRQAEEPAQRTVESVLDATGKLERITDKALDFMEEMLDSPTDWAEPKMVNAKITVAQAVINTQTKVDETRLRRRQTDILPKLLEIMSREEKRLPGRVIEGELA